jgi:hypothetical protein
MTFTDIAELKIRILGQDALKTFDALNASAKDVKDQLKEMELEGKKNTEEYKALARVQRDIQQEIKKTTQGIDVQNASMRELEALMKRKNQELKLLKVGSAEWIAKLKEIEPLRDRIAEINQQVRGLDTTTKAQEGTWTKYAGLVKSAFLAGAVIEFAKQVWDVGMQVFNLTAKFEKYETVLKNALGSQEKATAALKMLKEIAATTPFSLDEMTASFNKMVNRGLLPTSAEMKKLSDLAASQGKDFDQLTEAVLDAQMGEGERLKEFGIKMKKEGDNVSLSFKGQTTNVKNNEQAIYEAIVAMGEYNGVAGVTSEVSDKLSGKQSNLGDKIDFVTVQFGEKLKPVFHFILDLFVKGVGFVGDFIDKIGPLGVLVDSVADTFGGLWNIGKELFFKMFPQAQGQVFDMGKAVKILGTVLYAVLVPFQLLRAAVVGVIDVYRVLGNATSMVGKALQGDFNGAKAEAKQLETSWNNLKKNATENFGAISKGFKKIWTDSTADIKKTGKDWDTHVNDIKKGQKEMTANTEEETKKRTAAEKKANKEKEELRKEDERRFNELFDSLQDSFKEHLQIIKELEAQQLKERTERNKIFGEAIKEIEKNITKAKGDEAQKQEKKVSLSLDALKKRIQIYYNDVEKERADNLEKATQAIQRERDIMLNALDAASVVASEIFGLYQNELNRQMDSAASETERALVRNKQAWASVGESAVNALGRLASGDVVGAAIAGIGTLFRAMDNWVSSAYDLQMAKLADLRAEMKAAGEEFMKLAGSFLSDSDVDKINKVYDTLIKITEVPPVRLDLGDYDSYDRRIKQELAIGESINKKFTIAVENENKLYSQEIDNQNKIHSDVLTKINQQYDAAVASINKKFDLEQQLANRVFDAQSLGIQRQTNEELLALVSNNDTKLSLTNEFEGKKAGIMAAFASQIKPITADMTQAEIDGINRATEARDAQLAKLEAWLTTELTFVINNEGQKRKEYSATDLIIQQGREALEELSIKHAADEIARTTAKNIALAEAEATKRTATETAEQAHLAIMTDINTAYNDKLIALGIAKDAALAESFKILNDLVTKGYDDMMAKALDAYNAGKITSDQYNEMASRLIMIRDMLGQIDWTKLSPPTFDWNFSIPKFAAGTEYLDPKGIFPSGTDKVPIMADRGERIIDKHSNAMLGGISNRDLVTMVLRSNLYRNGPNVSTTAGMVNLASPASVQQASHISNNLSTTALENAVAQMAKELKAQSSYLAVIADKDPSINFHALSNAFKETADINARSSF